LNQYTAGELVTVSTESDDPNVPSGFTDTVTGQPADPGVVTLKWSISINDVPGETTVWVYSAFSGNITRLGTGIYEAEIDTTAAPGVYTYEWVGTDGVQAINDEQFLVEAAPL